MNDFSTVEGKDMVDWSLDELHDLYNSKGDLKRAQDSKDQKRIVGQDPSEFLHLKNTFLKGLLAHTKDAETLALIKLGRFLVFYEMRIGGRTMKDSVETQALAELMVGLYRAKHFLAIQDLSVVLINKDKTFNLELSPEIQTLSFELQVQTLIKKHVSCLSPMFSKLVAQTYSL